MQKPYPLWRIIEEEIPRADKTKFTSYTVEVKIDEQANWLELYSTISEPMSKIAKKRLENIFDIYIYEWLEEENNIPVMFEVHDQIYRTTSISLRQSCILGEIIPGNRCYGEFFVGSEKFDYASDIIFFYERGDILVKNNQLFLNGMLLYNAQELADLCSSIGQEFNKLDIYPEKLIDFLKKTYPNEIERYICNGISIIIRN